jgi:hypothetical protein
MTIDLELAIRTGLAIIALATFWKAIYEYMQQRADKRAQQFIALRSSFRDNPAFQKIISHLYGDEDFSTVDDVNRIEFMGFYEDLAFLMNSGLIRKEVAFYMFGGDVIKAWKNDRFWSKERKEEKEWALLKDFVGQMQEQGENFIYTRKTIKL